MSRRKRKEQAQERQRQKEERARAAKPEPPLAAIAPPSENTESAQSSPARDLNDYNQNVRISKEAPYWYIWAELSVAIGLLIFTAGQMYVGHRQWDATNKQYNAMVRQLDLMEEEQRAWLTIDATGLSKPESGKRTNCTFHVSNVGHTPAYIKASSGEVVWVLKASVFADKSFKFGEKKGVGGEGRFMLDPSEYRSPVAPGSNFTCELDDAPVFSDADIKGIEDGSLTLIVFCRRRYTDFVHKEHVTEACWKYWPEKKEFIVCDRHCRME
jgi:hypothetical protein